MGRKEESNRLTPTKNYHLIRLHFIWCNNPQLGYLLKWFDTNLTTLLQVGRVGLEPTTTWLKVRCSTNWANGPQLRRLSLRTLFNHPTLHSEWREAIYSSCLEIASSLRSSQWHNVVIFEGHYKYGFLLLLCQKIGNITSKSRMDIADKSTINCFNRKGYPIWLPEWVTKFIKPHFIPGHIMP